MQCAYLFAPGDLRLVEREPLALGPDDVRVEVAYTGICGTDLHVYRGMVFGRAVVEPVPVGHEFAGRVVSVGGEVEGFAVGDRVTAIPNTPCGRCGLCRAGRAHACQHRVTLRSGSWAPSLVVPAQNLYHLSDAVSERFGALTEPLACAVRAVDRAELRSGAPVCIVGAGPIGLFVLAVARASGAHPIVVSEPRPYRQELARRLGADVVVDPRETDLAAAVRAATDGLGAEVVFEVVGHPATIAQAVGCAAPGGTIVVVGVTDAAAQVAIPGQELFHRELTIRGTRGPTYAVERAIRWLGRLDLEPVITHTFPLARVGEAMQLGLSGDAGKILLRP